MTENSNLLYTPRDPAEYAVETNDGKLALAVLRAALAGDQRSSTSYLDGDREIICLPAAESVAIDQSRCFLIMGHKKIKIGEIRGRILTRLVSTPDFLVVKDDLIATAWPSQVLLLNFDDNKLKTHIHLLREALNKLQKGCANHLLTERGVGYTWST